MPTTLLHDKGRSATQPAALPLSAGPATAPASAIVILAAGMAAAWLAAGSTGLMVQPLQNALTWLALAVAVAAGWPGRGQSIFDWVILAGGVALGVIMTAAAEPVVGVLAVTLILAVLARCQPPPARQIVVLTALAAAVLGIFRLAYTSIPTVWLTANLFGELLGKLAGWVTGQPLSLGATFGGLDFLVLMAVFYAGWLASTSPPRGATAGLSSSAECTVGQANRGTHLRLARAIYAAVAILAGHLVYLIVLAYCNQLAAMLPEAVAPPQSDVNRVGVWTWPGAVRTMLPWNLPLLAGIIHATIAGVMFRTTTWLPAAEPKPKSSPKDWKASKRGPAGSDTEPGHALLYFAPVLLALTAAALIILAPTSADLKNKTILAYNHGYFDWTKPEHDRADPLLKPMFGMLPALVEGLGGRLVKSDELSAQELAEADVLLLVHPDQPWPKDRLERIWKYVRGGGSLLVAAGPRIRDGDAQSSFNEVLAPTAVQVAYDTAIAAAAHWEDCYQPLIHSTTAGIDPRRNGCGLMRAASLRVGWPARPFLAGRFAYSTPGSDAAETGRSQYQAGERLGDLVMAAEQPLGRGRIVVLGDASPLGNDGSVACYSFTGPLLGYLANKSGSPQAGWRQLLGLLTLLALAGLLAWRPDALRLGTAAVALSAAVTCCAASNNASARVLPDGRGHSPNRVAYIDASHLGAYSSNAWGDHGLGTFARTLMRNGYLPLLMPELSAERLERAGLLISIAPARRFSPEEVGAVKQFVEGGGTLICTVGAEEAATSRELLRPFGFDVPSSPVPTGQNAREPEPLGAFRQTFGDAESAEDSKNYVQFYAGWPVEAPADAMALISWSDSRHDRPIIVGRRVGRGMAAVIGDTYFAVNQNFQASGEEPAHNITFWRWLLSRLTSQQPWNPPAPARESGAGKNAPHEDGPRENDSPIEPDRSEAQR